MIRPISESLFRLLLLTAASTSLFSASMTIAQSSTHPLSSTHTLIGPLVITEVRLWSAGKGAAWGMGQMTVPDLDTTRRTDPKSSLRNYDRHIAYLFEMTYQQCEKNSGLNGMIWQYEAANGNIFMGQFRLRCQTSREVVAGYHLTGTTSQRIKTLLPANGVWTEQIAEVPQLHIVGNKAERWLDYVQTIPAVVSPSQKRLESMQAFPDERIQPFQALPTIPLRVPTVLPKALKLADRFILKAEKNSYHLCPATPQGECDRSNLYSFQQITGYQGRNFHDPKMLTSGAVYRSIELAHKMPGIYLENCVGQRCLSIVQWKQQGVLYEIQSQYREQPVLIKLANSAIESDPIPVSTLQSKNVFSLDKWKNFN